MSNAHEGIELGRRIIDERGIDLTAASLAYKSMHPRVDSAMVELALTLEVATISRLQPPFTVDSVAQQIADESGAYPWDGPVGNGFTLAEYRDRFRGIAREKLFLRTQLGLDIEETR